MKEKYILKFKTENEPQTYEIGKALANVLNPNEIILLEGNLAAGKTTISRSIFAQKGYNKGFCSPTFTIINEYRNDDNTNSAYHMDLYRIQDTEELEYTGFYDCLESGEFIIIEWPQIAIDVIDKNFIKIEIEHGEDINQRIFNIYLYDKEQYNKLKEALNAYSCD